MKIEKMSIINNGYIHCHSCFYSSQDNMAEIYPYDFHAGVNYLVGEIDSGVWAVSYLLSMYTLRPKDIIVFMPPEITVNDTDMSLKAFQKYSCYMDRSYPLFATKRTIRQLVTQGLRHQKSDKTPDDIRDIFELDTQRFERPLTGVGHEIFRAMAAIGYVHEKQVFCFPWLSRKRFDAYHSHLTEALRILEDLGKVAIVPIGE